MVSSRKRVVSLSTICDATELRQEDVRKLAPRVQAMIVVGGRNSGNTRRLAAISESLGLPTWHIETAEELTGLAPRSAQPGLEIVGAFSHLATADCDLDFAREQAARFRSSLKILARRGIEPPIPHLENSAGLVNMPESRFAMARPHGRLGRSHRRKRC